MSWSKAALESYVSREFVHFRPPGADAYACRRAVSHLHAPHYESIVSALCGEKEDEAKYYTRYVLSLVAKLVGRDVASVAQMAVGKHGWRRQREVLDLLDHYANNCDLIVVENFLA